jgi:hypothetical protein
MQRRFHHVGILPPSRFLEIRRIAYESYFRASASKRCTSVILAASPLRVGYLPEDNFVISVMIALRDESALSLAGSDDPPGERPGNTRNFFQIAGRCTVEIKFFCQRGSFPMDRDGV